MKFLIFFPCVSFELFFFSLDFLRFFTLGQVKPTKVLEFVKLILRTMMRVVTPLQDPRECGTSWTLSPPRTFSPSLFLWRGCLVCRWTFALENYWPHLRPKRRWEGTPVGILLRLLPDVLPTSSHQGLEQVFPLGDG